VLSADPDTIYLLSFVTATDVISSKWACSNRWRSFFPAISHNPIVLSLDPDTINLLSLVTTTDVISSKCACSNRWRSFFSVRSHTPIVLSNVPDTIYLLSLVTDTEITFPSVHPMEDFSILKRLSISFLLTLRRFS